MDTILPALVIPDSDSELQTQAIRAAHCGADASHAGQHTTELRVRLRYLFRNITDKVRTFIQVCDACQASKTRTKLKVGAQMPHARTGVWEEVHLDF